MTTRTGLMGPGVSHYAYVVDASVPITQVVAYTRVSTYEQHVGGVSLEDQEGEIRRYCCNNGWPLPVYYEELPAGVTIETAPGVLFREIESGTEKRTAARKELSRALRLMKPGVVFVVAKIDRFARSTRVALEALEIIKSAGARCRSVAESCDPFTDEGKYIFTAWASMAEMETARIAGRTGAGRRYRRALGYFVEGPVMLGYSRGKAPIRGAGKLEIVPEEAEIVRDLFELRDDGVSTHRIAAFFRDLYPDVRKWNSSMVCVMLRSRVYIGQLRTQAQSGEWIDAHPPIVSTDVFWRVQAKLDAARIKSGRPTAGRTYDDWFLHGLMTCGHCGGSICSRPYHRISPTGSRGKPLQSRRTTHTGYYFCSRTHDSHAGAHVNRRTCPGWSLLRNDAVHETAAPLVQERLEALSQILTAPVAAEQTRPSRDFAAERERIREILQRSADGYAMGALGLKEAKRIREEYEAKLRNVDAEEHLERAERDSLTMSAAARSLLKAVPKLRDLWRHGTPAEHRQVTALLASKVILEQSGDVTIQWRDATECLKSLGIKSGGGLLQKSRGHFGAGTHLLQPGDPLESVRKIVAKALETR